MLNSSFRYKRLAGGHIRFGEDIVPEAGSASGGMVAKTTRAVIMLRNPRSYQQFLLPSIEEKL